MLTLSTIEDMLSYDSKTGLFTWIKSPKTHNILGKIAGSLDSNGYIEICITINSNRHRFKAHRLAWLFVYKEWPNIIDHINGVRDDNRIENLRNGTKRLNNQNRDIHRNGKLCGVKKHGNKWQASIRIPGEAKRLFLGSFNTEKEAHDYYMVKAKELDI